ncbi:hypothetical protein [Actinomadura rupiterrae]|uniref:hypothetical protein n=1 Tax=Actinomadura rupiterrae TaxID=559627 RepID=UPI0020A3555A|nr:hypothetical protein [Actinomadura rupiterrae]MCP2340181.1 hypothetical protein [Actinomadura rupiterrae]
MNDHAPNGQIRWPHDRLDHPLTGRALPAEQAGFQLAEARRLQLFNSREWSQAHAALGAGLATLAVQQELAAARGELRALTEAVQGLAIALTTGMGLLTGQVRGGCTEIAGRIPADLTDRLTDALAELRDELCTEVAEAGARQPCSDLPRRRAWWPWRRREGGEQR